MNSIPFTCISECMTECTDQQNSTIMNNKSSSANRLHSIDRTLTQSTLPQVFSAVCSLLPAIMFTVIIPYNGELNDI